MKDKIPNIKLPCVRKVSRIEDWSPQGKRTEEEKEELKEVKRGSNAVRDVHKDSQCVGENEWVLNTAVLHIWFYVIGCAVIWCNSSHSFLYKELNKSLFYGTLRLWVQPWNRPLRSLFRRTWCKECRYVSLQLGTHCNVTPDPLSPCILPASDWKQQEIITRPFLSNVGLLQWRVFALNLPVFLLRTFSEPGCGLRLFLPVLFLPSLSFFTGIRTASWFKVPSPTPALPLSPLYASFISIFFKKPLAFLILSWWLSLTGPELT